MSTIPLRTRGSRSWLRFHLENMVVAIVALGFFLVFFFFAFLVKNWHIILIVLVVLWMAGTK